MATLSRYIPQANTQAMTLPELEAAADAMEMCARIAEKNRDHAAAAEYRERMREMDLEVMSRRDRIPNEHDMAALGFFLLSLPPREG